MNNESTTMFNFNDKQFASIAKASRKYKLNKNAIALVSVVDNPPKLFVDNGDSISREIQDDVKRKLISSAIFWPDYNTVKDEAHNAGLLAYVAATFVVAEYSRGQLERAAAFLRLCQSYSNLGGNVVGTERPIYILRNNELVCVYDSVQVQPPQLQPSHTIH